MDEDLFLSNLPWAVQIARSEHRGLPPSFDVADLEQIARIEHWKRVQLYDPSRGVPYQAYAYQAVRGAVLMACRRRHYRDATSEELSGNPVDARPLPDELLLAREEQRNRTGPRERRQLSKIREGLGVLSPVDAYLVRRVFLDGQEVKSLEAVWGKQLERRVKNAVRILKRALKEK